MAAKSDFIDFTLADLSSIWSITRENHLGWLRVIQAAVLMRASSIEFVTKHNLTVAHFQAMPGALDYSLLRVPTLNYKAAESGTQFLLRSIFSLAGTEKSVALIERTSKSLRGIRVNWNTASLSLDDAIPNLSDEGMASYAIAVSSVTELDKIRELLERRAYLAPLDVRVNGATVVSGYPAIPDVQAVKVKAGVLQRLFGTPEPQLESKSIAYCTAYWSSEDGGLFCNLQGKRQHVLQLKYGQWSRGDLVVSVGLESKAPSRLYPVVAGIVYEPIHVNSLCDHVRIYAATFTVYAATSVWDCPSKPMTVPDKQSVIESLAPHQARLRSFLFDLHMSLDASNRGGPDLAPSVPRATRYDSGLSSADLKFQLEQLIWPRTELDTSPYYSSDILRKPTFEFGFLSYEIDKGECLSGIQLQGCTLYGHNLDDIDFTEANFTGTTFNGMSLRGAIFNGATFMGATLDSLTDIQYTQFVGCKLKDFEFGESISNINFSRADFREAVLRGKTFASCHFNQTDFRSATLIDCKFYGCEFHDVDMSGSTLEDLEIASDVVHCGISHSTLSSPTTVRKIVNSVFTKVKLSDAKLKRVDVNGETTIADVQFDRVSFDHMSWYSFSEILDPNSLQGLDFSTEQYMNENFEGKDLSAAKFDGCIFSHNANLSESILKQASFRGADLSSGEFYGANLTEADLSFSIIGALLDADLTGAILDSIQMRDTLGTKKLSRVSLRNCTSTEYSSWDDVDLSGANLSGSNFRGSGFTGANLTNVDFTDCNLEGANLTGADITGAIFHDANLFGAKADIDIDGWNTTATPPNESLYDLPVEQQLATLRIIYTEDLTVVQAVRRTNYSTSDINISCMDILADETLDVSVDERASIQKLLDATEEYLSRPQNQWHGPSSRCST